MLSEADHSGPQQIFAIGFDDAFEAELDKLFDADDLFE
jgi:hypothetical protein